MTTYKWESSVRRYRDRSTGRFLSRKTVADLTLLRIKQVTEDLQKLGDSLITGESTLRQWQQQFAESLKILHTQQFLLGVGGDIITTEELKEISTVDEETVQEAMADWGDDLKGNYENLLRTEEIQEEE